MYVTDIPSKPVIVITMSIPEVSVPACVDDAAEM